MIDPALERRLADCRLLLRLWTLFQSYFEAAVKGEGLTPENEKKFLDLKSRIAMLHDAFMESVDEGAQAAVGQGMLDNVIRSITLKHINRLASADIRKMQIEWHESYLLLNESVASLEEKQMNMAKITPSQWKAMQAKKAMARLTANIYNSNLIRGGAIIGTILIVLVLLPLMGVFSYGALRDVGPIQKPVYFVIDKVVRPYLVKVNWRNINEAREFGAKENANPTVIFGDYKPRSTNSTPRSADQFANWISATAAGAGFPIGDLSGLQRLSTATEYYVEEYLVADSSPVTIFYFLMPTAADAEQACNEFRGWAAGLPPGANDAVIRQFACDNDYNLLILIMAPNEANSRAIHEQIWETHKVKKG
jgi:hypothetical protein